MAIAVLPKSAMSSGNGEKSRLYTILGVILVGLAGWAMIEIVSLMSITARHEQEFTDIKGWMQKIDGELGQAINK